MLFDSIPLWGILVASSGVIVAAIEIGFRFGRKRFQRGGASSTVSGAMVGATMGLLAFMLGFTFNNASGRHDSRKALVIEDVNAIETTWLRAGFLAEPNRTEMRRLLGEYVDQRVVATSGDLEIAKVLEHSDALLDQMWAIATDVSHKEPGSIMAGLFVETLNHMIDTQLKRLTVGSRTNVATAIWIGLYALAVVGMLMMGIQAGLGGVRQSGIELALALSFSIVLFLIADLDRPQEGFVNVSQQAMTELQTKLHGRH